MWPIKYTINVGNIWSDRGEHILCNDTTLRHVRLSVAEIHRVVNCYYGRKTLYVSLSWVSAYMEPNMYQFVKRLITFLVRYGIILKYNVIDQSGLQLNNMHNKLLTFRCCVCFGVKSLKEIVSFLSHKCISNQFVLKCGLCTYFAIITSVPLVRARRWPNLVDILMW